ncbi:MAG TPA: hypothetical protein VHX14_05330, partial [Thermoanaerobaculia bacterium]|nr:hypothetical protein [Thermoanaerobaculia bacterium]
RLIGEGFGRRFWEKVLGEGFGRRFLREGFEPTSLRDPNIERLLPTLLSGEKVAKPDEGALEKPSA